LVRVQASGRIWEDLSLWGDSGGSGWRKEAVKTGGRIHNIPAKTPREIRGYWNLLPDATSFRRVYESIWNRRERNDSNSDHCCDSAHLCGAEAVDEMRRVEGRRNTAQAAASVRPVGVCSNLIVERATDRASYSATSARESLSATRWTPPRRPTSVDVAATDVGRDQRYTSANWPIKLTTKLTTFFARRINPLTDICSFFIFRYFDSALALFSAYSFWYNSIDMLGSPFW